MPPSPGKPHRSDTMKDTILRESTAGWSNSITPLRIAKRDTTPGSTVTGLSPTPNGPRVVVARRSSNSYKHVFNNNLVSKSPFKSQIPTPAGGTRNSPRNIVVPSPRGARKVSGEKRPRPDSLVQQAEMENIQRVKELGFKRRQSKGFQGLVEKEPVSKSPFRRIVSPDNIQPISIELPTKHYDRNDIKEEDTTDTTSVDTTDFDSFTGKNDVFSTIKPVHSPIRPITPSSQPSQSLPFTPSSSPDKRPYPSVQQASPTRSSLVQRPRLLGPRSRSFSNSPADTPRKTVTFNDGVDVVEFDRASHEDRVFETDDEDVYGPPDGQHDDDSSFDSNGSYNNATPTHQSPNNSRELTRPTVMDIFGHSVTADDSISGLVDSMLQEASAFGGDREPTTPESHQYSFALDADLVNGGNENGVPHGRIHHSEFARMQHQQGLSIEQPRIPGAFDEELLEEEPSFSSISLSTPPRQSHPLPPPHSEGRTPLPVLPPDTELAEDGMPLGRTHHAERARAAHQKDELEREAEKSIDMIPPSPSPMRKKASEHGERSQELPDPMLPKFDLGIDFDLPKSMERSRSFADGKFCLHSARDLTEGLVDVFGSPESNEKFLASLSFEHPDIDPDILSNTSIASFHDIPPQPGYENSVNDHRHDSGRQSHHDHSGVYNDRSNLSLDASVASIVHELQSERERTTTTSSNEVEFARSDSKIDDLPARGSFHLPSEQDRSTENQPPKRMHSPAHQAPERPFTPILQSQAMSGSQDSLSSNNSGRRSPRISREDVMRRLVKQRSTDNMSPLGGMRMPSPALSSMPVSPAPTSPATQSHRPPLEERLRRALSPTMGISAQGANVPSPYQEKQSTPSRSDVHVRAHTYDTNGRPLPMTPLSATFDFNHPGVDIADMRSALDRLVQDVGGRDVSDMNASASANNSRPDRSDGDISMAETELCTEESTELLAPLKASLSERPLPMRRNATAPTAPSLPSTLLPSFTPQSRSASGGSIPPAPPPKESGKSARQEREELIKEKRREARARDSGEFIPPRRNAAGNRLDGSPATRRRSSGRPSARRSLSTGDAEDMLSNQDAARRRVSVLKNQRGGVLGVPLEDEEDPLTDCIERELKRKMHDESRKVRLK